MQYTITPSTILPARTICRQADFSSTSIHDATTRLRSWALVRGEQIVGLPFLRMLGPLSCEVHVPVAGKVSPHPETGIAMDHRAETRGVGVRVVRFDEVRAVIRALSSEIAVDCGLAGPVEFHPASADFSHGTLLWPVHRYSPTMGGTIAVPGDARVAEAV
jgi:hypothetical protein